ncbi:unnamed protein product [Urochloa decumbens]|uniref:Uncharacterized protein n=1 Tax=Urochloa decumbens TaxID=240449 RepID=A0ABC8Z3C1_9POAL
MCLWFACFGLHKDDDVNYTVPTRSLALPPPPPATKPQLHDRPMPAAQRNGGYYHHANAQYGNGGHHQTAAADEACRKASNDARKPYTYAGAGETVRQQPAWNGSVAGEAGHGHGAQAQQQQHYYHYSDRQPVHREAAAMDHRYYTAATATADHERY